MTLNNIKRPHQPLLKNKPLLQISSKQRKLHALISTIRAAMYYGLWETISHRVLTFRSFELIY